MSWRNQRKSVLTGRVFSERNESTYAGQAVAAQGGIQNAPETSEIQRMLMEGLLLVGVTAGIRGQNPLSQDVLMTGVMAGLGLYVIDMYAPMSSEAVREGVALR